MKQLLTLKQDFIIETKFQAIEVKDEAKPGWNRPDWVDDKKEKANGKQHVSDICMLVQVPDRDGYFTTSYQKVWVDKGDILQLAEKIKELEAVKMVGVPGDYLPF